MKTACTSRKATKVGHAPVAHAPGSPERSLPVWIAPVLLAGLVAVAAVIVLIGWFATRPAASSKVEAESIATVIKPILEPTPAPPADKALHSKEPVTPEEPEPMELPRRLPARPEEPKKLIVAAPPEATPQPILESPIVAAKEPSRRPFPAWKTESAGTGVMFLAVPVEVARIDGVKVPHTIRRLQLTDVVATPLKLAVTPVVHDDLGSVLTKMGDGYRYAKLRTDDLISINALKKHDVVFLTCADLYARDFRAVAPLRKFVQEGGTLYASDLYGDLLQATFPEFRARTPILPGVPQRIDASVVESGLQSYLGHKAIPLYFDAPDWRPAPFEPNKVTVCLTGTYRNNLGQTSSAPILVKFRVDKGTVIFTSFHHTKNNAEIAKKLLDYLIFAAVSARSEARVRDLMQRSGFAPTDLRPMLASAGADLHSTFHHPGGGLQIAVGFEHGGATLKLRLRSPNGQVIEHIDRGLYLIEIPNAEVGTWQYTVTPVEVPFAHFPIVVGIGTVRTP